MEDNDKDEANNKNNNNEKGISALGLDRDLWFSRGHQGHRPHDYGNNQEEDNKVEDTDKDEDNDKDDDNNKDSNNDKGILALEIDRDLGFLRGHQGHQSHVFCHKMCNFKDNYGEHLYNNNNISSRLS